MKVVAVDEHGEDVEVVAGEAAEGGHNWQDEARESQEVHDLGVDVVVVGVSPQVGLCRKSGGWHEAGVELMYHVTTLNSPSPLGRMHRRSCS